MPSVPTLLERLARVIHNDAHADGLKPTQWEALRYLARANRFSRSPSALTSYLGVTKGTVSQTLQALERKGLIEKTTASQDRRAVALTLTVEGEELLVQDPLHELEQGLAALPEATQHALGDHLQALMQEMLKRRDGRPFGACRSCSHFRREHEQGDPHFCGLLREPLSVADSQQHCVEQTESS